MPPASALGFKPTLVAALSLSFPIWIHVEDSFVQAWLATPSALTHLFTQSQVFAESAWARWLWRESVTYLHPAYVLWGEHLSNK